MYISSVNTWASGDSSLAHLVKELDLCLFVCVIRGPWDQFPAEPIDNSLLSAHYANCEHGHTPFITTVFELFTQPDLKGEIVGSCLPVNNDFQYKILTNG